MNIIVGVLIVILVYEDKSYIRDGEWKVGERLDLLFIIEKLY